MGSSTMAPEFMTCLSLPTLEPSLEQCYFQERLEQHLRELSRASWGHFTNFPLSAMMMENGFSCGLSALKLSSRTLPIQTRGCVGRNPSYVTSWTLRRHRLMTAGSHGGRSIQPALTIASPGKHQHPNYWENFSKQI